MPRSKGFKFHGAFSLKKDAVRKERKVGGFVRKIKVQGQTRYAVITKKK